MSDFVVEVHYTMNGVPAFDRYFNRQIHSCIRATKRKRKGCLFTGTKTYENIDKCVPTPPEGWQPARFKVKTKKNRWGRIINIPEEMNYEVMNEDQSGNGSNSRGSKRPVRSIGKAG